MECEEFREVLSERIGSPMVPLSSLSPMDDGNMENISPTIPVNISRDPSKIENVYIREKCSHAKIQEYTIDPCIVEHEIKTYPNAKPIL